MGISGSKTDKSGKHYVAYNLETPSTSPLEHHKEVPAAPSKRHKTMYYLFLDIQTTHEERPQLLAISAVMYSRDDANSRLQKKDGVNMIVHPKEGYSILQQMQDMRYHGITIDLIGRKGKEPYVAVNEVFQMVKRITGTDFVHNNGNVVVVGHGIEGMLIDLLTAAKIDTTLHPLWEQLEALGQSTEDTLDCSVLAYPDLSNYTLEHVVMSVAASNRPPQDKAHAVARLFCKLNGIEVEEEEEVE